MPQINSPTGGTNRYLQSDGATGLSLSDSTSTATFGATLSVIQPWLSLSLVLSVPLGAANLTGTGTLTCTVAARTTAALPGSGQLTATAHATKFYITAHLSGAGFIGGTQPQLTYITGHGALACSVRVVLPPFKPPVPIPTPGVRIGPIATIYQLLLEAIGQPTSICTPLQLTHWVGTQLPQGFTLPATSVLKTTAGVEPAGATPPNVRIVFKPTGDRAKEMGIRRDLAVPGDHASIRYATRPVAPPRPPQTETPHPTDRKPERIRRQCYGIRYILRPTLTPKQRILAMRTEEPHPTPVIQPEPQKPVEIRYAGVH
jgi:hypothetical protein